MLFQIQLFKIFNRTQKRFHLLEKFFPFSLQKDNAQKPKHISCYSCDRHVCVLCVMLCHIFRHQLKNYYMGFRKFTKTGPTLLCVNNSHVGDHEVAVVQLCLQLPSIIISYPALQRHSQEYWWGYLPGTFVTLQVANLTPALFYTHRANVIVTDLEDLQPLLELNIRENQGLFGTGSVTAKVLKWFVPSFWLFIYLG